MITKVDKYGRIDLLNLFTVKQTKQIFSYNIDKVLPNKVAIYFYDVKGNTIIPKLRRRGKAKKA